VPQRRLSPAEAVFNMACADLRIVLHQTSHPGNIGAAARAMKTMGLADLWLVAPQHYPDPEATARASGATDVLDSARCSASLDEALAGCVLVIGTTARERHRSAPVLDPRTAVAQARTAAGPVALLFGPERIGLTNAALDRCHYLVRIPTNPAYGSLNLAAAVQVLAYEWRMAEQPALPSGGRPPKIPPATADEMARFYGQLEQVLRQLDFFIDADNPTPLMRRLKRLFNRAALDREEYNILCGILGAIAVRKE